MRKIASLLLLATASWSFAANTKKPATQRPSNEPFSTFEQMDKTFTALTKQQEDLRRALAPVDAGRATETKPGTRNRWARQAQNVYRSARSIRVLAERQQRRYRDLRQTFGVRAFSALASRAKQVEKGAQGMQRTRNEGDAAKQQTKLESEILDLVRQYQSIAGGYGAARCQSEERPACLAKESGSRELVACSWVCVRGATPLSKGFSGPAVSSKPGLRSSKTQRNR
jgi:hypothetical protein